MDFDSGWGFLDRADEEIGKFQDAPSNFMIDIRIPVEKNKSLGPKMRPR